MKAVVNTSLYSTVFNNIYDGCRNIFGFNFHSTFVSLQTDFEQRQHRQYYCRYNCNLITNNQINVGRNFGGKTSFCVIVQYSICLLAVFCWRYLINCSFKVFVSSCIVLVVVTNEANSVLRQLIISRLLFICHIVYSDLIVPCTVSSLSSIIN